MGQFPFDTIKCVATQYLSVRLRSRPFANRLFRLILILFLHWEKALTRTTNLPVKLILRESAIKAQHTPWLATVLQ